MLNAFLKEFHSYASRARAPDPIDDGEKNDRLKLLSAICQKAEYDRQIHISIIHFDNRKNTGKWKD